MTPRVLGDLADKHWNEFYEMFSNILARLYMCLFVCWYIYYMSKFTYILSIESICIIAVTILLFNKSWTVIV